MKCILFFLFGIFSIPTFSQLIWKQTIDSCNFFSSPNATDLNADGVLDIVIGGGIEYLRTSSGVLAFDGKTSEMLWSVPSRSQIYTSPIFQDVTSDGILDVFIGGRDALYFCIDGKTGRKVWEFWPDSLSNPYGAGWYNFYGCMFTLDFDKDGYKDVLLTNGGDHLAKPTKKSRPTANLLVLSGKTGKIIKKIPFGEQKESYYAPHTYDFKGKSYLIYGSGGETIGGSLRKQELNKVINGSLKNSTILEQDTVKGFILNSAIAHLNEDNIPDLVTIHMNGSISAISTSGIKLWSKQFDGYENYVTPSLGYFNADDIPDIFTIFAQGQFPMYSSFKTTVFDGKTGELLYESNEGVNQFSPGVSVDLNQDKQDEFIYIENQLDAMKQEISWRLKIIDPITKQSTYLTEAIAGCSMASSPLVIDLDNDGNLEIVVAVSSIDMVSERISQSTLVVFSLGKKGAITWGKYLGPDGNGVLMKAK